MHVNVLHIYRPHTVDDKAQSSSAEPPYLERYLEGQGDLVSRLVFGITHIVTQIVLISNLLTKSP